MSSCEQVPSQSSEFLAELADTQAANFELQIVEETSTIEQRMHRLAQLQVVRRAQQGDAEAMTDLWLSHDKVARSVARNAADTSSLPADERLQICREVIPATIMRFDPRHQALLATFLRYRMDGALKDAERSQLLLDGVSRNGKSSQRTQSLEALQASPQRVQPVAAEDVAQQVVTRHEVQRLSEVLGTLDTRERAVIVHAHGVFGAERLSNDQLADMFNVTKSRISQIRTDARRKMAAIWNTDVMSEPQEHFTPLVARQVPRNERFAAQFSPRQLQVAELIHLSYAEIGAQLTISTDAARTHANVAMQKIGVQSANALLVEMVRHGLFPLTTIEAGATARLTDTQRAYLRDHCSHSYKQTSQLTNMPLSTVKNHWRNLCDTTFADNRSQLILFGMRDGVIPL